ncbi:restriction endonuclease subunit S [Deinococcus sp. PESE-13]
MIHDLRPYPAMKDSGVPWLGPVPGHWAALSIRRFSKVFAGATPSRAIPSYWEGGDIPWLASGDVNQRFIHSARQFITEEGYRNSSTKWIRPGSVVIALAGQGKTKGLCATVEFKATCNQSLAVVDPDAEKVNYTFLAYYLESRYFDIRGLVGELRDGLNLEHIKGISVPVPPPAEQAAIVRFLDHADRRIRKAIAAKQRLIKLLQEQKQVIIHQAVTRGLDPNVKLKPSGVEWLGNVPEGWEVVRSKRLFRASKELARSEDVQLSATQAFGVIPQEEYESRIGRRVTKIFMHLEKRKHVEKDDFVLSMRSFQGGLERAWSSGAIRSSYVILRPTPQVYVPFFAYLLKSPGYIRALQSTANFIRDGQDLTEENFRAVELPLIPLEEQKLSR